MARTKPAPVETRTTPVPAPRRRTAPASSQHEVVAPARRRTSPAPKTEGGPSRAGTPKKGRKVLTRFTEFFHNWGGCLPFVDLEECTHPRVFRQRQLDGVVFWIDNGICKQFCPNGNKHCSRYEDYWKRGGSKQDHEEFLKQRFVAAGASNGGS